MYNEDEQNLNKSQYEFESTEYSQETPLVYTQEYPIPLPMVGIGQRSRLTAHCLPIEHYRVQCA